MRIFLLNLIICVFMLTSCSGGQKEPVVFPDDPIDNTGEHTVLYCGDGVFPISNTVDGKEQIANGTYWYYELPDCSDALKMDSYYTYNSKNLELKGNEGYDKLEKYSGFATNGNWPLFLNPVHSEYTVSNQSMVDQSLIVMAEQQLKSYNLNAPTIITDVWNCDMDGDGGQEYLFKAANYDLSSDLPKDPATEEQIPLYCFLGYAKGDVFQMLYGVFKTESAGNEEETAVVAPYVFNEKGETVQTVIRRNEEDSAMGTMRPIICDTNGDGKWSVMIHWSGSYESFILFDYAGGNFTKCYEIIF